jgi:UDP:flavonoid glycosyltransferase YjiC (YdhE family)
MKTILIISPPFYSHFSPLLTIAKALKNTGRARVVFATAQSFEKQVTSAGLNFTPLEISPNANTGIAEQTRQNRREVQRLQQFFKATYRGAIPTLVLQTKHRRLDMLPDPLPIYQQIQQIQRIWQPSLYLVDQLNYAVTLSLYALGYPFLTFCPGHPTYIPVDDQVFGVPYAFPSAIRASKRAIQKLNLLARQTEQEFTAVYNRFLQEHAPNQAQVENAFGLASSEAILFNYPDFGHLHLRRERPKKFFAGHCFSPNPTLQPEWQEIIQQKRYYSPKILISFGTFLSARTDVLKKILHTLMDAFPKALLIVATGARSAEYSEVNSTHVILREFLPQTALLPYIDLVIHHGGNNTFTETLYHAKPMVIFPFSSDQFAIACDAERFKLGQVLDPNNFLPEDLAGKIESLLSGEFDSSLKTWSEFSQSRGATYLAESILSLP